MHNGEAIHKFSTQGSIIDISKRNKFMAGNIELGLEGEQLAKAYLEQKGYQVLQCNWRHARAEIDLICKHMAMLIFVEIKTRKGSYYGEPELAISTTKQKQMIAAAEAYIYEHNHQGELRFDTIAIQQTTNGWEITHFEDAFYPYQQ
ncbi:MAG: YraN family protein [Chitinophagales bacterium]|nr:YraN family protein [Chitinophagales bacterium]